VSDSNDADRCQFLLPSIFERFLSRNRNSAELLSWIKFAAFDERSLAKLLRQVIFVTSRLFIVPMLQQKWVPKELHLKPNRFEFKISTVHFDPEVVIQLTHFPCMDVRRTV